MNRKMRDRCELGFTLMELLIVMSIAAVLLTIGIPSFKYVTTSNRVATEVNGLLGDLQFARSEAVKEGLPVTVCSSPDGMTCGNSHWQNGWIVFLDSNGNHTRDANEAVLRTQSDFSVSGDTFQPAFNVNFVYVTFNREGYASTGPANAGTVTLELHDSTNTAAFTRCLQVTSVGMLSMEKSGVGNCS